MIDEKKANEERGVYDRSYVTCEKYGDIFELRAGLACLHPKEKCKYRLNCQIYQIGKND